MKKLTWTPKDLLKRYGKEVPSLSFILDMPWSKDCELIEVDVHDLDFISSEKSMGGLCVILEGMIGQGSKIESEDEENSFLVQKLCLYPGSFIGDQEIPLKLNNISIPTLSPDYHAWVTTEKMSNLMAININKNISFSYGLYRHHRADAMTIGIDDDQLISEHDFLVNFIDKKISKAVLFVMPYEYSQSLWDNETISSYVSRDSFAKARVSKLFPHENISRKFHNADNYRSIRNMLREYYKDIIKNITERSSTQDLAQSMYGDDNITKMYDLIRQIVQLYEYADLNKLTSNKALFILGEDRLDAILETTEDFSKVKIIKIPIAKCLDFLGYQFHTFVDYNGELCHVIADFDQNNKYSPKYEKSDIHIHPEIWNIYRDLYRRPGAKPHIYWIAKK